MKAAIIPLVPREIPFRADFRLPLRRGVKPSLKILRQLPDFNGNKNGTPNIPRYTPMMPRTLSLIFLLLAGALLARASDPITATYDGAGASVTQPHVTAELIPEKTTVAPGAPFALALPLH